MISSWRLGWVTSPWNCCRLSLLLLELYWLQSFASGSLLDDREPFGFPLGSCSKILENHDRWRCSWFSLYLLESCCMLWTVPWTPEYVWIQSAKNDEHSTCFDIENVFSEGVLKSSNNTSSCWFDCVFPVDPIDVNYCLINWLCTPACSILYKLLINGLMGYALCRPPLTIAHCFKILDSWRFLQTDLRFLVPKLVIWHVRGLRAGVLWDPGTILGHWGAQERTVWGPGLVLYCFLINFGTPFWNLFGHLWQQMCCKNQLSQKSDFSWSHGPFFIVLGGLGANFHEFSCPGDLLEIWWMSKWFLNHPRFWELPWWVVSGCFPSPSNNNSRSPKPRLEILRPRLGNSRLRREYIIGYMKHCKQDYRASFPRKEGPADLIVYPNRFDLMWGFDR